MHIGSTITYYMKINNILGIARFKWQIIKQFDMNWASDCIRLFRFVCRFFLVGTKNGHDTIIEKHKPPNNLIFEIK